jgi:hypothetical protein
MLTQLACGMFLSSPYCSAPWSYICRIAGTNVSQVVSTIPTVKAILKGRAHLPAVRAACLRTLAAVARALGERAPTRHREASEAKIRDARKAVKDCDLIAAPWVSSSHPSLIRMAALEVVARCVHAAQSCLDVLR